MCLEQSAVLSTVDKLSLTTLKIRMGDSVLPVVQQQVFCSRTGMHAIQDSKYALR